MVTKIVQPPAEPATAVRAGLPTRKPAAQDGQDFSGVIGQELQKTTGAPAPATAALIEHATPFTLGYGVPPEATAAAPPGAPPEAGQVTDSGAPKIVLLKEPSWDRRNYTGPALYNPYYGTSTNPLRPGNVTGFENWFQTIQMGPPGAPGSYTWPPAYSANAEGGAEALRLVRQYVSEAQLEKYRYTGQVGEAISYAIILPDGGRMNAGLLLDAYYHQGQGVDSNSDHFLRQELAQLTGNPELRAVES